MRLFQESERAGGFPGMPSYLLSMTMEPQPGKFNSENYLYAYGYVTLKLKPTRAEAETIIRLLHFSNTPLVVTENWYTEIAFEGETNDKNQNTLFPCSVHNNIASKEKYGSSVKKNRDTDCYGNGTGK